jgi:nucleotide-binding universal stress UspA family protein
MENILVPTDFSDASFNAISYAAFLANIFDANLLLLHVYPDTAVFQEQFGAMVYQTGEESETSNEAFLQKQIDGIARRFTVKINSLVLKGNPVYTIREVAKKYQSDIIILGMKGKGESNSVFGSTTTAMIDNTSVPLLVIPKNVTYQTIDTITIATDFKNEQLLSHYTLLAKVIAKFNPFIQIVNIQKKNCHLSAEMIAGKMREGLEWDRYNHSFNTIEKDKIEEGIDEFLAEHSTDLLVMVTRRHNFIQKVFVGSHTKKMTHQTKKPLLIFHGYENHSSIIKNSKAIYS